MAAVNVDISSALLGTKLAIPGKFFPSTPTHISSSPKRRNQFSPISARLGGEEGDDKKAEKKKFITREQEPEQYWQSAGERAGENPMKTPLPYIIIFGMSTPFVILAIAFANGWVKVPIR